MSADNDPGRAIARRVSAYNRGWSSGNACVDPARPVERADNRGESPWWYVGFNDAMAGNPKGTGLHP